MVNTIITGILIITLFLLGHITQGFKKIISLFTDLILKFLNLFGIKINRKEKHLKVSKEFKETYKDIKIVKLSKKNIKQKHSIDFIGLIVLFVALILFIVNLDSITGAGYVISDWFYSWMIKIPFLNNILTPESMNTYYTAVLFSIMSFSISRIVIRWKETKQQRIEAKNAKIKKLAIELMDSKELVDQAKKKDENKRKELE